MTLRERIAAAKKSEPKKPEPVRPPWLDRLQAKEMRHVG